ncbi:hypothetical protein PIB30_027802 [Stylosanthes scabra]|uniref:RING-type domain-containing protein n=1 Tax=Stylosanthes scabra TaxID=79078 RepID=A0ABU6SAS8_9FABA|nr:hypothetical protein [Stylosanthes scabra]
MDPSQDHCFEDLVQLEKYILAELICVLREVRPFFSTGDAMWCLLICDMNVSHACAMDADDPFGSDSLIDGCSSVQPESQSNIEEKGSELTLPGPCESTSSTEKSHVAGNSVKNNSKNSQILGGLLEKESADTGCSSVDKSSSNGGTSQSPLIEEKCGGVRKVNSTGSKRDYILRQKSFHVEKSYRTYGSKGSSRGGKASGLSSLILDRKLKSVSEATTISLKSASLKISKTMGVNVTQDNLNPNISSNGVPSIPITVSTDSTDTVSRSTDTLSLIPEADTIPTVTVPTALSATDTDLSLSLSPQSKSSTVPVSCNNETPNGSCTGILFDKSLEQWIPQDRKDEMIVKLIPRVRELQNQLQEWTEWANQKVMQAARRLSKDRAELKTLRQEKDEVERLKKEKQTLEENTMKKLSEMENALCKASRQVERANAAVRKLELENAMLRREMEAAKLRAAESATSCLEVSRREKRTQMKFQSWEKQKSLFQEELMTVKCRLAQIQQDLEQAKVQQEQAEARWEQAAKAKDELLLQASSIRKEREQIEESTKSKEEMIKSKAQIDLQRNSDEIQMLEKEIAQMRLKTDSFKIAALRRGINGSNNTGCTDTKNSTDMEESRNACISELVTSLSDYSLMVGVKRERECVMCLSEEMSVVFLPCAHQVVCTTCNELHEKQGMQDCPSCRSPIQRRISVRYAHT